MSGESPPEGFVSFIEMKQLARERLLESSLLRRLLLAEKDYVPAVEAVTKVEVYGRLFREEMGGT